MTLDPQEKPLAPEVEKIRKKMLYLLIASSVIMVIALMVILIAIIYKINQTTLELEQTSVTSSTISVPTNATILNSSLSGNQIMLILRLPKGKRIIKIYKLNGQLISQLCLKGIN
ncbi:hypothetical protein [Candidatus Endowatersipora endosymbiont of Watersipora subatra]|uniref:hypothetical protein n=1 Tax=Candidatus Endowatersipora endosymbiont of Watersipora subatra TaxID=3077946 RepID=UPI00312C9217